jgi:hypothetical protein
LQTQERNFYTTDYCELRQDRCRQQAADITNENDKMCSKWSYVLILFYLTTSETIGLRSNIREYNWNVCVNNRTGLAQSIETSCSILTVSQLISVQVSTVKKEFENYPRFLGRIGIPGLNVVELSPKEEIPVSTTCVRDSVFGIKLLEFGTPTSTCHSKTVQTVIPILDGLLVRKSVRVNHQDNEQAKKSFGHLRLIARFENDTRTPLNPITISTELIDYPPTIVGPAPVCSLRKALYLKSQGLLHAYVMWRFHGHCYKAITNVHNDKTKL